MIKKKRGPRISIIIECFECQQNKKKFKKIYGISRYITSKNRHNNPKKLELFKYCCFCKKHTNHKELK